MVGALRCSRTVFVVLLLLCPSLIGLHPASVPAIQDRYVPDVFSGKFLPSSIVLSVNGTATFTFTILPSLDLPDVSITMNLPEFVVLLGGIPVWRGPVVAGRLAKLEFSIQAKEDFSASIGARVEAAEMPTNYYILPVRTMSVGTLQARVANLTDFVRVQTNAGPPHITQTAAGGGGYSPLSAGGYITVRGTFVYQVDLTGYCPGKITPPYGSGNYCPMRRVEVVLYDGETWPLSPREISRTTTDDNGNYIFAGISNDDGWLGGGLDTYVEVLSTNLKAAYDVSTHVALTKPSNGAGYAADTPQVNDVPDGSTVDYGIRYPTQNNEAWESIDAVLREYDWVRSNSGTG